eukprot:TRINITY_DN4014_c0_g5_i1.p1 TRINITY_DN4014_c0_g5~~TRINITY_DN4014_c0_g5_i1.p1  ORF type:complete len:117 (+),score=18.85 TRINITY_DN4014_c0_g5_i1:127-477(+)
MNSHSKHADVGGARVRSALLGLEGRRIIVTGNPGVGKSTLLNSFFTRGAAFKLSWGGGLKTQKMSCKKTEHGIELFDTPGLSDEHLYKAHTAEISKAQREATPFGLLSWCGFNHRL